MKWLIGGFVTIFLLLSSTQVKSDVTEHGASIRETPRNLATNKITVYK